MAAARILGACGLLLASIQAVQGVTSSAAVSAKAEMIRSEKKEEVHNPSQTFMKTQELPDVHGDDKDPWTWTKDGKGGWQRSSVTPEEAATAKDEVAKAEAAGTDAKASSGESSASDAANPAKSVNIDVYYETMCPGCLLFLNRTLEPLWRNKELYSSLNITLYTYGNGMTVPVADISEGYKFWHPETTGTGFDNVQICQHGSDECLGNLVQNCAKDVAGKEKHMELIFCMAASTIQGNGMEKGTFECMKSAGIDHDKVKECVNSPRGNQLATEAGQQTKLLKDRQGTPWVMIANEHVHDELLMNGTLLMQAVCSHVGNVPVPCTPFTSQPLQKASAPPQPTGDGDDFQVFEKEAAELIKVKFA